MGTSVSVGEAVAALTKQITCPECGRTGFKTPAGLASHRKTAHGVAGKTSTSSETQFKCELCGRSFNAARALGRHKSVTHGIPGTSKSTLELRKRKEKLKMQAVNGSGKPDRGRDGRWLCPLCDRSFKGERWRTRHINSAHKETTLGARVAIENGATPKTKIIKTKGTVIYGNPNSHPQTGSSDDDIPFAVITYACGQIEFLCRAIADANHILAQRFTKRCIEHLSRSAVR